RGATDLLRAVPLGTQVVEASQDFFDEEEVGRRQDRVVPMLLDQIANLPHELQVAARARLGEPSLGGRTRGTRVEQAQPPPRLGTVLGEQVRVFEAGRL